MRPKLKTISEVVRRFAWVYFAVLASSKVTVRVLASRIPGQPFYRYSWSQWGRWIFDPLEAGYLAAAAALFYVVAFLLLKRVSELGLAIWGGMVGAYCVIMFSPLDYSSRLEATIDSTIGPHDSGWAQLIGAILEFTLFGLVMPLVSAWVVKHFFGKTANGGQ